MKIVPAKCPFCGGTLQVDSEKDAAICEFCKQPFIVEKAINNYNTTVVNNYNGATIMMQSNNGRKPSDHLSINCSQEKLNECIDLYTSFGYEYVSGQHVFNQTEKISNDYWMNVKSETVTTANFISVSFRRFRDIENYDELVRLENEYNDLTKKHDKINMRSKGGCVPCFIVGGLMLFIGLIMLLVTFMNLDFRSGMIFGSIPLILIGIAGITAGCLIVAKIEKINQERIKQRKEIKARIKEVVKQAKQLNKF